MRTRKGKKRPQKSTPTVKRQAKRQPSKYPEALVHDLRDAWLALDPVPGRRVILLQAWERSHPGELLEEWERRQRASRGPALGLTIVPKASLDPASREGVILKAMVRRIAAHAPVDRPISPEDVRALIRVGNARRNLQLHVGGKLLSPADVALIARGRAFIGRKKDAVADETLYLVKLLKMHPHESIADLYRTLRSVAHAPDGRHNPTPGECPFKTDDRAIQPTILKRGKPYPLGTFKNTISRLRKRIKAGEFADIAAAQLPRSLPARESQR